MRAALKMIAQGAFFSPTHSLCLSIYDKVCSKKKLLTRYIINEKCPWEKGNTCFSPLFNSSQLTPQGYLGGRHPEHSIPPSPSPHSNKSPLGILKLRVIFFPLVNWLAFILLL
jgi:hypothetical protein